MPTLHLLMVDDDDVQRRALRRAVLRTLDEVRVVEASDGQAGLAALREGDATAADGERYLVVLDLEMAPVDGFGFLEQLRSDPEWKNTIVFVLSGRSDGASRDRAYGHAIAGFIRKDLVDDGMTQILDLIRAYRAAVSFPADVAPD